MERGGPCSDRCLEDDIQARIYSGNVVCDFGFCVSGYCA
jgi:hypothetical protein